MKPLILAISVSLSLASAAQAKTKCDLNGVEQEFMNYTPSTVDSDHNRMNVTKVEAVTYIRKLGPGKTFDVIGAAQIHTLKNNTTRQVDLFRIKASDSSFHQIYAAVGLDSVTCRLLDLYKLETQEFNFGAEPYYPEQND